MKSSVPHKICKENFRYFIVPWFKRLILNIIIPTFKNKENMIYIFQNKYLAFEFNMITQSKEYLFENAE